MNYNKIVIVGRVGQDPELKALNTGDKVCKFSVATSRKWNNKNGELQEETEWHNVVFWNKPAEIIAQYIKKGSLILVDGRVQTNTYEKDGVTMYRTQIIGETFQLPPRSLSGNNRDEDEPVSRVKTSKRSSTKKVENEKSDFDESEESVNPNDIPF